MSNENNNGLYFIVGILVAAVVAVGAIYLTQSEQGESVVQKTTRVVEKQVDKVDNAASNDENGSSFEFSIGDDGFSASSKNNN